uniref:ATP synthase F0 subunit 8 n=1 Tax=Bovicola caprae TaxID=1647116 RepID=A0A3P8MXH4_9NEOP|nr:ATP synthase F0 subunit 8 [Bovicola caprae]
MLAALHFSFPMSRETDKEGFSLSNTFRVHKKNDLSFSSQSSFLGSSISK